MDNVSPSDGVGSNRTTGWWWRWCRNYSCATYKKITDFLKKVESLIQPLVATHTMGLSDGEALTQRLLRRLDKKFVSLLCVGYLFALMDRSNLGTYVVVYMVARPAPVDTPLSGHARLPNDGHIWRASWWVARDTGWCNGAHSLGPLYYYEDVEIHVTVPCLLCRCGETAAIRRAWLG